MQTDLCIHIRYNLHIRFCLRSGHTWDFWDSSPEMKCRLSTRRVNNHLDKFQSYLWLDSEWNLEVVVRTPVVVSAGVLD
jgi:hypothetical protein